MSGLMLCTKHSENPFKLPDTDIKIYSIEELAYYLYHNAYFVDDSFFSVELMKYIGDQLHLKKIATKLEYLSVGKTDFTEKVMTIVAGSHYYTENELKDFEKELKSISSKSMQERMVARARMLYEHGRLLNAKTVYENILKNATKNQKYQEDDLMVAVYMGLGEILCRQFYFNEALEVYEMAYLREPSKEVLRHIIFAKLMREDTEGKTHSLEREQERDSELTQSCLQEYQELKAQIRQSEGYQRIVSVFEYDGRHNLDDYYENMQTILDEWKGEYRSEL